MKPSIEAIAAQAIKNHPCIDCVNAEHCKSELTACEVFLNYLPYGEKEPQRNGVPELKYKYFVAAFIEFDHSHVKLEPDQTRAYWVWQRDGYAGSFSCSDAFDPRCVLDERYELIRTQGASESSKLELELNVTELSEVSSKIRLELDARNEMTCGELSMLLNVRRRTVSVEARKLVKAKKLRTGVPRVCSITNSDRIVTTWSNA